MGRKAEAKEAFMSSAAIYSKVKGADDEDTVDALQRASECE